MCTFACHAGVKKKKTQHLAACVFIRMAGAVAGQGVGEPDVVVRVVFRSGFLRLLTLS